MATTGSVNADLVRERAGTSFPVQELTYVWDGSRRNTERRKHIENLILSDPEFTTHNQANMSRDELFSENVRKHVLLWKKMRENKSFDDFDKLIFFQTALGVENSSLMLHEIAFLPMLRSQSSPAQLAKWGPLLDSYRMVGCYAQTELGHGTFIRGLETTATYDPLTKTFIISSPSLTSTKWWIGSMGLTANHAVVMAQLYTKGQCHGIHAFLVQLRDMDTHKPLPGVTVGDIGPKLGLNAVDNGFLRLHGIRIPRENMLMKHSQVLEDGTFVKPKNDKIVYAGMLGIRAQMVGNTAGTLGASVTIATRYSCVRRQSELKPGSPEVQVIDFQTQQDKLFPWLATSYAYCLSGHAIMGMFREVMNEVNHGNFTRLIEVHALSAGLKALTTTRALRGIEQCRLSCGGHGYSLASGIPQIYAYAATAATAEGESTVLLLQTARYLVKNCINASQGKRIDAFAVYLTLDSSATSPFDGRTCPQSLLKAYAVRTRRIVTRVATRLQQLVAEKGMPQDLAWNDCSVDLATAAVAHIDYVLVRLFVEFVEKYSGSVAVKKVLETLCRVYALHGLVSSGASELLQDGYLTSAGLESLNDTLYSLYKTLRPDAVALVDAFDIPDGMLQSAIGRYDGRVYESLFEFAKQSKLNASEVHESFHKYLKPLRSQL